jgi:hypothetical protein
VEIKILVNYKNCNLGQDEPTSEGQDTPTKLGTNEPTKGGANEPQNNNIINNKNLIIKETKALPVDKNNLSITKVIEAFREVNPTIDRLFANKRQRESVIRLINLFGENKLCKLISILPQTNSKKYAPKITTPLQLEDKAGALIAFIQSQEQENENNSKKLIGITF